MAVVVVEVSNSNKSPFSMSINSTSTYTKNITSVVTQASDMLVDVHIRDINRL